MEPNSSHHRDYDQEFSERDVDLDGYKWRVKPFGSRVEWGAIMTNLPVLPSSKDQEVVTQAMMVRREDMYRKIWDSGCVIGLVKEDGTVDPRPYDRARAGDPEALGEYILKISGIGGTPVVELAGRSL